MGKQLFSAKEMYKFIRRNHEIKDNLCIRGIFNYTYF